MIKPFLFVFLIMHLFSCANEASSEGILSKNKMELVLWDFIKADVFTEQFIKKDSLKNAAVENMKLQQQIFEIHKVTREEFYKSYTYYTNRTDLMKTILDSITVKGERSRSEMIRLEHGPKQTK